MPPDLDTVADADHELLFAFDRQGLRLNDTLYEMLNEDHKHQTERRGCGFTQATRHIAEYVNVPRQPREYDEARLFADRDSSRVRALVEELTGANASFTWRHLDRLPQPEVVHRHGRLGALYEEEAARQRAIRSMPGRVAREESRLLAQMISDLILPVTSIEAGVVGISYCPEVLKIGTCPLSEKYFLELADGFVRRRGMMNVIVSSSGVPVCIEKVGLGDNHSCVSLTAVELNGVRLPKGSLLGVKYAEPAHVRRNRTLPGNVIPLERCDGFRFLRLTTLAVTPANRKRAFSKHFEAQVQGGLFAPGRVTIEDIEQMARQQL